ncbi:MBL fold metallo-hydrolase [Bdellovibrio bacteriovorus]|uniref:MBL fold metallo-hydrolase n=1 Tax=Bdellovibrio bacteriovorus TaxID=959 RepID=UPI0021D3C55D|nr:MBL fold metallo-hydrolase [Bdellovibrio bacteriovorus]UXR64688.1 MBL fold metallo-hydrolase [Bdellovibrio bacteriovorus]
MKILIVAIVGLIVLLGGLFVIAFPAMGTSPGDEEKNRLKKSAQYNPQKHEFQNRIPDVLEKMRKEAMSAGTLIEFFAGGKGREPAKRLPEVKPDLQEFLKPSDKLKVIWMGHSTFLLNLSGKIILVDPVFSGSAAPVSFMVKRFQPPPLSLSELPKIDVIVISHDHYDHLDMQAIKFFADKDVPFLTPLGVGAHLRGWGIADSRISEFDWWQGTTLDGVEFIATPAQHFSGRGLRDGNKTLWASWVIRSETHNVFFSGDSGYDIHFKQIGDKYGPFEIAFIENGQYNEKWRAVHALPEESVQAYFDLKAQRFFPVHWGMFSLAFHSWRDLKAQRFFPVHWGMFSLAFHSWRHPVDSLVRLAKERGVRIMTPQLGEMVYVDDNYQNVEWWQDLE